jgi:tetratricopeptide (TPR) repeat protein/energy-coupling factor transporter ATP-binding protein EcfA2
MKEGREIAERPWVRQDLAGKRVRKAVEAVEAGEGGRVIFLNGPAGSGKSHLLCHLSRTLAAEAPNVRVVASDLDDPARSGGGKTAAAMDAQLLSSVATLVSELVGLAVPAASPGLQALTRTIEASSAASAVFSRFKDGGGREGLTGLFEPVLAAAAREEPGRPLVCLLDDANLLDGTWWLSLQFSFAAAIARELPLVLVLSIDTPEDGGESSAGEIADSLVDRGLADRMVLGPLTPEEVDGWIGPLSQSLSRKLVEATGGYPGDLLDLWREVQREGQVERGPHGWVLKRGEVIGIDYGAHRLAKQIASGLGPMSPEKTEMIRRTLAVAALEGNTFTADAVASTCEQDRDEIVDLLDALVEGPFEEPSPLIEVDPAVIDDATRSTSRHLWRYRFRRTLDWRVARLRLADATEGDAVRRALADHLIDLYEPEVFRVAHVVASLLRQAEEDERAERYDRVACLAVSQAVLQSLARNFMEADTGEWDLRQTQNAADILLRGCWQLQGTWLVPEVIAVARRAEELALRCGPPGGLIVARALCVRGRFEFQAGNTQEAWACLTRAIEMSRRETPAALGESLRQMGSMMWQLGRLKEARRLLEEAQDVFHRKKAFGARGGCLSEIAEIDRAEKKLDAALARNTEALACSRAASLPVNEAAHLHQRASIALDLGQPDAARKLILGVLPFQRENRRRADEAACLRTLAIAELASGRPDAAKAVLLDALALEVEQGKKVGEGVSLMQLGEVEFLAGRRQEAKGLFERAEALFQNNEDHIRAAKCGDWLDRLG